MTEKHQVSSDTDAKSMMVEAMSNLLDLDMQKQALQDSMRQVNEEIMVSKMKLVDLCFKTGHEEFITVNMRKVHNWLYPRVKEAK